MTVYVIEDHPLMRDALTMLIHRVRPGLKVVPVPKMNVLDTAVEKNGPAELFCLDLQLPDTLGLSGAVSNLKCNTREFNERLRSGGDLPRPGPRFVVESSSPVSGVAWC